MTGQRTATFAGFLNPDDFRVADGLVTIDCERGTLVRSERLHVAIKATGLDAELLPSGQHGSDYARSPRPYTMVTGSWGSDPGRGIEDICRDFAAQQAPSLADEVPGDALEVWLLPVTDFRLGFLITPAGEWLPAKSS